MHPDAPTRLLQATGPAPPLSLMSLVYGALVRRQGLVPFAFYPRASPNYSQQEVSTD